MNYLNKTGLIKFKEKLVELINNKLSSKEDNTNKVTSIDKNSTNQKYPSAKAVYDYGQSIAYKGEIYDGQERVIGTWFGKPLYRKTIAININESGEKIFAHNIANVKIIMPDLSSSYIIHTGQSFPLTAIYTNAGIDEINDYSINLNWVNSQNFNLTIGSGRLGNGYITLKYTKTTD